MVQHANLTGAELHEPKGADSANADEVYIADGAGSGAWTAFNNFNKVYLHADLDDLSSATSYFVVAPLAGDITAIYSVIDSAIAGSDVTLSLEIGGVAVTDGTITITVSGSAAGDVDSANPSANNTVTSGQAIEIVCGGETTTTDARGHLVLELDVT